MKLRSNQPEHNYRQLGYKIHLNQRYMSSKLNLFMFLENKVSPDGMSVGKGSALPSSIGSLYNYIKNDGGMYFHLVCFRYFRMVVRN